MLTLMGSVAAAANILGDYNHDGVVDAADYTVWRDTYGQSVTENSGADGNGDGMIDRAIIRCGLIISVSPAGPAPESGGAGLGGSPRALWLTLDC